MNTYYVVYLNAKGEEEEISASFSDAYSFAEEMAGKTEWYGHKIIKQGWRGSNG